MKGKMLMEAIARAASEKKNPKAHEAAESPAHEQAEMEGQAEMGDELCPDCHAKVMKHLASKGLHRAPKARI